MNRENSFRAGFWTLAQVVRQQSRKTDQVSEIYRRQTRKIPLLNIFARPTRKIEVAQNIFKRPTRIINVAPSIFRRPTRKLQLPDIYQRPTQKIQLPGIYERQPRQITKPLNILNRKKRQIVITNNNDHYKNNIDERLAEANHAAQMESDAPNIRPCSVVLDRVQGHLMQIKKVENRQHAPKKLAIDKWMGNGYIDHSTAHDDAPTIFYNDKSLVNGPLPLARGIYYDLYDTHRQFAVDDFKEGKYVNHHFLTRFHPDQYAGLTRKFNRYIYASRTTAYLVQKVLKVDGSLLRILNPGVPVIVDGVEITAINLPSYPGALMILFKTIDGKVELHGGHMHTSTELEENPVMWNVEIDAIIIHNNRRILTNTNVRWDETDYRNEITDIIDEHMETQRRKGLLGLIVFNSHKRIYSMEKFFISFASFYGLSIWIDDECRYLIDGLEIEDGNVTQMLASCPEEAGVHILSDEKFETNNLLDYLGHMDNVHHMLVFRVSVDDTSSVSLDRPFYNQFPLKVYNIPNAFGTTKTEYDRLMKYIRHPEFSAANSCASDFAALELN